MSKQILVIHGGNVFDTHDEYVLYLKNKEVSLEKLRFKDWKRNLSEVLGTTYDVLKMLDMQNGKSGLKRLPHFSMMVLF